MQYFIIALLSITAGYGLFHIVMAILPRRLRSDHKKQYQDIVEDARHQASRRRETELERLQEEAQLRSEQLEADLEERKEDLKIAEDDLDAQDRSVQLEETRLQKIAKEVETHTQKVEQLKTQYETKLNEIKDAQRNLISELEQTAKSSAPQITKNLHDSLIESKRLECQKVLKYMDDELSSTQKRLAQRLMNRVMSRYAPDFYWPKSINVVEFTDPRQAEKVLAEGEAMIAELKEKGGCEIEVIQAGENSIPMVKLAGGAGIDREAVRLCLTEILPKGAGYWAKAASHYERHRQILEQQAIQLGKEAIIECQLANIHPEIQKLVGYLNWRTSYRQNQWYHTVEVAKLAGIIASELGVDPDHAKRVGLLHDIGKALDYRIEGSHAVISGDYADRFGENRIICDTVMSHHNDLVIESPLAYVLKAADTLSGARPGARVNLEEGYQMRLSGIESCVRSFQGVMNIAIMNGAREVHVEVNHKKVRDKDLEAMSQGIAKKITENVAFPGEIKILVTRRFEATAVA